MSDFPQAPPPAGPVPGPGRAPALALELALVFGGAPLPLLLGWLPGWKLPWLLLFLAACAAVLWHDPGFDRARLWRPGPTPRLRVVLLRAGLAGAAVLALTVLLAPDALLAFPRRRPGLWLAVMALYPLLSAYPQEFIYRAFFFRRYQGLFRDGAGLCWASAAAFAWVHVIYGNPWAVLLSLPVGWLLADTYRRTRSLFWTTLEHALYGGLAFTLGLGRFFYQPPA